VPAQEAPFGWSSDGLAPLEVAGLRLDAAILRLELADAFAVLSPANFADVETEFLAAQDAYRTILSELTGTDPETILRRLAR
jgi:hypothetical protein